HPVCFRLDAIELRRVPALAVAGSLVKPLIDRVVRAPGLSRERLGKIWRLWRTHGFDAVADKLVQYVDYEKRSFEHWATLYDAPTSERLKHYRTANQQLSRRPMISILLPVYNPSERWLRRCIE